MAYRNTIRAGLLGGLAGIAFTAGQIGTLGLEKTMGGNHSSHKTKEEVVDSAVEYIYTMVIGYGLAGGFGFAAYRVARRRDEE